MLQIKMSDFRYVTTEFEDKLGRWVAVAAPCDYDVVVAASHLSTRSAHMDRTLV